MTSTIQFSKVSGTKSKACTSHMIGASDLIPYISKFMEAKFLMACNLFFFMLVYFIQQVDSCNQI